MVFAAAIRFYLCLISEGIIHPDELYQYIEPAFGLVFGYWTKAMEFVKGVRSYFYPLINALIFEIGTSLGIQDVCFLILGSRLFNGLLSTLLVFIVYLTARTAYNRDVGLYAAFMSAFSSFILAWTPRTMSELPSTFFLMLSVYLFTEAIGNCHDNSDVKIVLSGISLGVSCMFRLSSAIALLPLFVYLVLKRKLRKTVFLTISFVSIIIVQGFLDYIMYGRFFSSFSWVVLNIRGLFPAVPFYYYIVRSPYMYSFVGLFLLGFSFASMVLSSKRNDHDWIIGGIFLFLFVGHSLAPYKEVRFILTTAPLAFLLAARGLEKLALSIKIKRRKLLFITLTLLSFLILNTFTISQTNWTPLSEQTRAVYWVGEQPDLHGLICEREWWESGVYTYLHRNVPVYFVSNLTTFSQNKSIEFSNLIQNQTYNYVLTKNEKTFLNNYGFVKVNNFEEVYVYKRLLIGLLAVYLINRGA